MDMTMSTKWSPASGVTIFMRLRCYKNHIDNGAGFCTCERKET